MTSEYHKVNIVGIMALGKFSNCCWCEIAFGLHFYCACFTPVI